MTTVPPPSPYQQAQYPSPLPVRPTHLGHALASEWTKIRTVRSTLWTLGVMLLLVIGINLLIVSAIGGDGFTSQPVLSAGLSGIMLGQLCVITLGVLVVSSEYGTGMIRTTMTACPKRARVLTAKVIVFFTLSFTVTTLACTLTALLNYSTYSGQAVSFEEAEWTAATVEGGMTTASGGEWIGATVGVGLYVALLGLLALAVGTLLRHSAGAITTMMGVVLLPLIVALFMGGEALETVREKLIEYSSPNALATLYRVGEQGADGTSQLVLLACVTAVALGGAYAALASRDV